MGTEMHRCRGEPYRVYAVGRGTHQPKYLKQEACAYTQDLEVHYGQCGVTQVGSERKGSQRIKKKTIMLYRVLDALGCWLLSN